MIWITLISVMMTVCLCLTATPSLWLIAIAVGPLVLLSFWKKSTLKNAQNIFAIVYALALGCIAVQTANNARASAIFCPEIATWKFFCIYFAMQTFVGYVSSAIISRLTRRPYAWFALALVGSVALACIPQTTKSTCAVGFGLSLTVNIIVLISLQIQSRKLKDVAQLLEVKNVTPFLLLRNLGFVLFVVNCFVIPTSALCSQNGIFTANLCSNIVCAALMTVLTFTYLRQPLDDVAENKIKTIHNSNFDVETARKHLFDRLCNYQNYPLAAFLKKLFSHVFRCKFVGAEKISDETACFVANHYEIYGPFICALHFPYSCCIWTEASMTKEETIAKQMQVGVDVLTKKWLIAPIRKAIPRIAARPLAKFINYTRPIAVYRLHHDQIDKMFEESVTALTTGDNLIVFPEKPRLGAHYKTGGIDQFQTGFVEIAERYYQATGKTLAFYPLYVDKKGNKMTVGDKVTYNHDCENPREEKIRVARELYDRLNTAAQNGKTVRKRKKKN